MIAQLIREDYIRHFLITLTMACAYVTLVMKGDSYIPGALALAYSLRQTGTKHDLVCMVTPDVTGIDALSEVFDHVVKVDYLTYETWHWQQPNKHAEAKYNSWMSVALTQFRCLGLVHYRKVFFLDADVLVHRNMDCVFKMRSPAGTFVVSGKAHGEAVHPREIEEITRRKGYVCVASSLLLSPGKAVYRDFLSYVEQLHRKYNGVIGEKGMKSGINEQIIAWFYSEYMGYNWTNLSNSFQHCRWVKPDAKFQPPFLHHYVEPRKPWEDPKRTEWWDVARKVVTDRNRRFFPRQGR